MQPCARSPNGVGYFFQRLFLRDYALAQLLFHMDELLHFALQHAGDRNAGPVRYDLRDIFLIDFFLQHLLIFLQRAQLIVRLIEILLQLDLQSIAQFRDLV